MLKYTKIFFCGIAIAHCYDYIITVTLKNWNTNKDRLTKQLHNHDREKQILEIQTASICNDIGNFNEKCISMQNRYKAFDSQCALLYRHKWMSRAETIDAIEKLDKFIDIMNSMQLRKISHYTKESLKNISKSTKE